MAFKKLIGLLIFLMTIGDFLLIVRASKIYDELGLLNPFSQSPISNIMAMMLLIIAFLFSISILLKKSKDNQN